MIEKIKFHHRNKIIRKLVMEFDSLMKKGGITKEQAGKIQNDIQKNIIEMLNPIQFNENLKIFFTTHPEFKKTEEELKNMFDEMLQKIGEECSEAIIDQDPEAWEKLTQQFSNLTEENIEEFGEIIPETAYPTFVQKLINA